VPRVLSGIQPTGDVHLGNYIGAIRQYVAMQEEADAFYCIVDLHAITVPQDPKELPRKSLELATILMAAGLDPARCTLFVQSHVPEHTELAWILNTVATFGELRRMTQFKDKAARQAEKSVSVALFDYPVLQAADILIYQADEVPVGEDQRQHLELTRDIAERFNTRYGETFVVPKPRILEVGSRIMDLQEPTSKMSKSAESPAGTLGILDSPEVIAKKIRTAVTDSGREILARSDKPAISNLLAILSAATGKTVVELEASYEGKGYAALKSDLVEAVIAYLAPIRTGYEEFCADPDRVREVLEEGATRAQAVARETLALAKAKVGLLPRLRD